MKMYSSDAVTKDQVESAVQTAVSAVSTSIDEIDKKQSLQIKQLRRWCIGLTVFLAAHLVANIAYLLAL
jgi:hypothetical protein